MRRREKKIEGGGCIYTIRIDEGRPTKKALTNIDDTTMAPRTQRGNIIYIHTASNILNMQLT
jgi:hypothetical protein